MADQELDGLPGKSDRLGEEEPCYVTRWYISKMATSSPASRLWQLLSPPASRPLLMDWLNKFKARSEGHTIAADQSTKLSLN